MGDKSGDDKGVGGGGSSIASGSTGSDTSQPLLSAVIVGDSSSVAISRSRNWAPPGFLLPGLTPASGGGGVVPFGAGGANASKDPENALGSYALEATRIIAMQRQSLAQHSVKQYQQAIDFTEGVLKGQQTITIEALVELNNSINPSRTGLFITRITDTLSELNLHRNTEFWAAWAAKNGYGMSPFQLMKFQDGQWQLDDVLSTSTDPMKQLILAKPHVVEANPGQFRTVAMVLWFFSAMFPILFGFNNDNVILETGLLAPMYKTLVEFQKYDMTVKDYCKLLFGEFNNQLTIYIANLSRDELPPRPWIEPCKEVLKSMIDKVFMDYSDTTMSQLLVEQMTDLMQVASMEVREQAIQVKQLKKALIVSDAYQKKKAMERMASSGCVAQEMTSTKAALLSENHLNQPQGHPKFEDVDMWYSAKRQRDDAAEP